MKTVFVIGGIGSGKSTVSRLFEDRGASRLDLDEVGHEILCVPEIKKALAASYGDDVISAAGEIDRKLLAARAFANTEATTALNSVTIPLIGKVLRQWLKQQEEQGCTLAVVEVSAFRGKSKDKKNQRAWTEKAFELNSNSSYQDFADYIIVVVAPEDQRIQRALKKGFEEADITARIARQPKDTERKGWADFLIENKGSLEDLGIQVDTIWEKFLLLK